MCEMLTIFSLKPYKKSAGPGGGGGPNNSGATLTPSSSTLVINSLAYQILPPGQGKQQSDSNDLGSAGYSSPSSTTSSPQQQGGGLAGLQSASSPVAVRKRPVADDTDGHLAYLPGDVLGERYEIVSTLGELFYSSFSSYMIYRSPALIATLLEY